MTDQEDRREESLSTEETRYEREREAEEQRRDEAAERLKNEPLPEPREE